MLHQAAFLGGSTASLWAFAEQLLKAGKTVGPLDLAQSALS